MRSADDARARVQRHDLALPQIDAAAWDHTVEAGVALGPIPDDVFIVEAKQEGRTLSDPPSRDTVTR
ncbi:hypothetical protein M6B22_14860 [Jatrophihabitans cynanchi]|uniref:Uncharacterized protein n=1 Tax=Jatrophihabitans cynanchi TaxID=2944128 RepID=A0ABY7JVW1_9ACTN|nr:hypothetical protein [Jatrophihabitans sp. SB3-54]WAX55813.1 hypothetical protein M6B22_14860 [Jatrophihabitans sp. SB3-54]